MRGIFIKLFKVKTMKKLIFIIGISLTTHFTFAKKTDSILTKISLNGNVVDKISEEALVGVEVKIDGTELKTYTDFDGHFVIDNLKVGDYKLVTNYTSYNKKEKTLKLDSKSNSVKIELTILK